MAAVSITASSFVPSSQAKYIRDQVSGEALTAGQPVYKNASGVWVKAQGNATGTYVSAGLAAQTVGAGVQFDVLEKDPALVLGGTLTEGVAYCVGATASGTIEPLADLGSGEFVHLIGLGVSSSVLALDCTTALKTTSAL